MNLKKLNENAVGFQIEKIANKTYKVTFDAIDKSDNYSFEEIKFDGTIKQLYEAFENKSFEYSPTVKGDERFELLELIADEFDPLDESDIEKPVVSNYTVTNPNDSEYQVNDEPIVLPNTIPTSFNGYFFPKWRNSFARRVNNKTKLFLSGPAGSGKSEMIVNLAKMVEQTCIKISFHSSVSTADLIGKMLVQNGATVFKYGYIPLAMKRGWWVILDEIDYADPSVLGRMQSILEGNELVVTENEGEIIHPHENFRIFATANTKGRGDESNSYSGTNFLNASFLDRFTILETEYTEKEYDICFAILEDENLAEKIVKSFQLFRKSIEEGSLTNSVFSTRRMIAVCNALYIGDSLKEAFDYEVLSRYTKDEAKILLELLKDVFDSSFYMTKKWTLGMEHKQEVVNEQELDGSVGVQVQPNQSPIQTI